MKTLISADPGLSGAIGILKDGEITLHVMPTLAGELDLAAITDIFAEHACDSELWIEQVSAMPGQGVTSMFTFGKGYGMLQGIAAAYRIPIRFVHPKTWQKTVFEGINTKAEGKERNVLAAKRLFPSVNLLATERSKKPHLGLVDALLILEHSRRQNL